MTLSRLRVCQFGQYDPQYSRNTILAKCLKRAGAELIELADRRPLAVRTPALIARAARERIDLIIVGFRAHADVAAAKLIAKAKRIPLIFDPLLSRYDERVVDRQLVSRRSPLAHWYRLTDALGCRLADTVLLETEAQITFFAETFSVPLSKCERFWLGADEETMYLRIPQSRSHEFTVFFYGRFGPLQGVEHIVKAASIVQGRRERVRFVIVGSGQTHLAARELAAHLVVENVRFMDPVPYEQLAVLMSDADVCLGVFGTSTRTQRVIPHKVFDALAVGRPVITGDTPAVREALIHGDSAWLCPCGDSEGLADSIMHLKHEPELRRMLAVNGHVLFKSQFSLEALSGNLATIVSGLVDRTQQGR